MKKEKLILFAGPASKDLGSQIARYLNEPLGFIQVGAFSDGETSIEISQNIRGMDVFLVQSTYQPGNEHLMQLLLMADACKGRQQNQCQLSSPILVILDKTEDQGTRGDLFLQNWWQI